MKDNPLSPSSEQPRIIAGSGRSGTTWILDVLAQSNGLRPIFEPLHPVAVRRARKLKLRYLSAEAPAPELKVFLADVFAGHFDSVWTNYRVRPDRLRPKFRAFENAEMFKQYLGRWRKLHRNRQRFGPKTKRARLLVKFIRANLMLEWLRANFDARIVLIVRHPGAVVESQLRLGGDWDPYLRLDQYRNDEALVKRYGVELEYAFRPGLPVAEALTAIWVIENKPAVDRAVVSGYDVVFYENLREHPEREWGRTIRCLGLNNVPERAELTKPSQQTDAQTVRRRFDSGLDVGWLERIGSDTMAGVRRVLTETGVEFYEAGDPRPRAIDGTGGRV